MAKGESEKMQDSNEAKDKPAKSKGKAKAKANEESESAGFLANLRPKKRAIFFATFLGGCAWIIAMHDTCDQPVKSRKDCGYEGISPLQCQTTACMLKGGGSATVKKTVKVHRKDDETLGLSIQPDRVVGWATVTGIREGAVKNYNMQVDSEDMIQVGDRIAKVDGTGAKGEKKPEAAYEKMVKALEAKGAKTVQLEVQRPKISPYLLWLRSSTGKPTMAEKVITSPGFKQFSTTFSYVGGIGVACWLVSGYPPASLPLYYGGLSAVVAFWTVRCCHDSEVGPGVPHCYKPKVAKFEVVLDGAKAKTLEMASSVWKNPRAFLKRWLVSW